MTSEGMDLEIKRLEIAKLKRPPYRDPDYLRVCVPIGLAMLAMSAAWFTG